MEKEFLVGQILIRTFRAEDVEEVYKAARESIKEISPWMPWCHENFSIAESANYVLSREDAWKKEEEYSFAICDAETGRLLGSTGLNQFNRCYQFCSLGYWVRTSAAGRGVASQAARRVAQFGLEELHLQRIQIVMDVENSASRRAAEKAGARQEGILRKRLLHHGNPRDAFMYSLIAEDFKH